MEKYTIIHVGKTGGAALAILLEAHKRRHPDAPIRMFGHDMTLYWAVRLFPDARVVFFVRDPATRFASGFNSRLRRGKPRNDIPWTPWEEAAFSKFQTPNALAEALSSGDKSLRAPAHLAMFGIEHIRWNLVHYLHSVELLEKHARDIAFIGEQEHYAEDIAVLRRMLGIDPDLELPTDDWSSHRTPDEMSRELSELALRNLRTWFPEDYAIVEWEADRAARPAGLDLAGVDLGPGTRLTGNDGRHRRPGVAP
jgi:hypothetical protein